METVHTGETRRMNSMPPSSSGATVTSLTTPPEASLRRMNMSASGLCRFSGFCAPRLA